MPVAKASPLGRAKLGARAFPAYVIAAVILQSGSASQAAERCDPGFARIVSLQGQVEVQAADAAAWLPGVLDERLCIGDTVRVGELARAALLLADNSVLRLDALTTLRLVGETDAGSSWLDLLFGDVHFFSHRPQALEVDTPIFSAATEGTEFLLRVRPERADIVMFDGRVRLHNPQGELLVASGDAGVALPGEAPRREIVVRPRDAVAWALYYPPVLAPLAERAAPPALPPGLQRAVEQVATNDYAGAIAALDAVPEAARDARYFTYRAGVLLNVGRIEEAADAIERALTLAPDAADALAERAVIAVAQNRIDAALADARRALEFAPDSAPARIALSYALQAAFDLDAARAALRSAAAATPDDPLVQARLAELELSFGELDAAEAAAERAVALAPGLARTQMVLGFAALTRIDVEEAKTAFRRAIALDSAEPLARLGLGLAKIRAGDLGNGRRELEVAAALDPNNSLLRSYLGKAYFEERRGPLDADQFRIAKELDPNDPTPWFYDAIRLQSENRPVEALRNLEKSIALNDNRAVYRSRLLLDEDRATRGVSLARIYDDLGFEQVALVEATKSLSQDPANWSAHRFLSDTYAGLPRHEIARASELLQAQLLQPININPVQPSAPITDLNVAAGLGPAKPSFNEFTPLFERNRAQITGTLLAGNRDTFGDEVVVSGIYNRFAVSAGQFHSGTDGFRKNDDVDNDLYDLFAQAQVTPKLSVQAEYRDRETRQGDLALNFDPDSFDEDFRRRLDQRTGRLGAHFRLSPQSSVISSLIYTDRDEQQTETTEDEGYQAEIQYILSNKLFSARIGVGSYDIQVDPRRSDNDFGRTQQNAYAYGDINWPENVTWVLGLSYDNFHEGDFTRDQSNPKFGVIWAATDYLTLRAAAFSTLKRALAVDQTVEPTQVAGFNQFFDDFNGAKTTSYAAALDARLSREVQAGVEVSRRNIQTPNLFFELGTEPFRTEDWQEDAINAYLYWTPLNELVMSVGYKFEYFDRDEELNFRPRRVRTNSIPLELRYFHENGFFLEIGTEYVYQDVRAQPGSGFEDGNDRFAVVDATLGYRLPERYGILTLEFNNLLDQGFKFQDDNFRNSEQRAFRLTPEQSVIARATLTF